MDFVDEENIPSLLMSVDFQKAFDCIRWDFIDKVLDKFNFGPSLRQWVDVFYTEVNSRVINNGWMSEMFRLERGARQGCPLSPYIFIICVEILSNIFRNDRQINGIHVLDKNFIISQYADDTLLTLQYSQDCLRRAVNIFQEFETYSGLKVNFDKTEIVPLGPIKETYEILFPESGIKWSSGPIRVLGVTIYHEYEYTIRNNYNKALKKIANLMKIWQKRYLTPYGKVVVLNTFIISQFVYLMSVLPSPSDQTLKELEKDIFKFIWNNKPDKIKRTVLKYPKHQGGLSVPDIFVKNKALKIAWIQRLLIDNGNSWSKFIYKHTPIKSNQFWNCNLNNQDIIIVIDKCRNMMIKDIIKYWFQYKFTLLRDVTECALQNIVGNSLIRVGNKPIYNKDLIENNILMVIHLFDSNGLVRSYEHFILQHGVNINYVTYYGIIMAIPNIWKLNIRSNGPYNLQHERYNIRPNIIKENSKICKKIYNDIIINK